MSQIASPHAMSQIASPHAMSQIASPHAMSQIASPHAMSQIASPHAMSQIASPHAMSQIASPHAMFLYDVFSRTAQAYSEAIMVALKRCGFLMFKLDQFSFNRHGGLKSAAPGQPYLSIGSLLTYYTGGWTETTTTAQNCLLHNLFYHYDIFHLIPG